METRTPRPARWQTSSAKRATSGRSGLGLGVSGFGHFSGLVVWSEALGFAGFSDFSCRTAEIVNVFIRGAIATCSPIFCARQPPRDV